MDEQLVVRPAESVNELKAIFDIEIAFYGDEMEVTKEQLIQWWRAYPAGATVIMKGDVVIGGMGLWPLTTEMYAKIESGELAETDIKAEHIDPDGLQNWYVGDIIICKQERKSRTVGMLSHFLVSETLRHWRTSPGLPAEVSFCAAIYTRRGEKYANDFRFQIRGETADGFKMYGLTLDLSTFERRLGNYERLREERKARRREERLFLPVGTPHIGLRRLRETDLAAAGQLLSEAFDSPSLGAATQTRLSVYCENGLELLPFPLQYHEEMRREYWVLVHRGIVDSSEDENRQSSVPRIVTDRVIGITGLYNFAWTTAVWVGWTAITPDYAGKGLGRAMLSAIMGVARSESRGNCDILKVETGDHDSALGFYMKLGFVLEGSLSQYYNSTLGARILTRSLAGIAGRPELAQGKKNKAIRQ